MYIVNGFLLLILSYSRSLRYFSTCICIYKDCTDVAAPTNGQVNMEAGPVTVASGSSATYTCNSGYTLNGDNSRLCTASVLDGTLATCDAGKSNRL